MEISKTRPASEERILGALAHGSVLLFFFGFFVPALIWGTQRRKSGYAAFQALQALGYQVISYTLWILIALIMPFLLLPIILGEAALLGGANGSTGETLFPFTSMIIFWGMFFGLLALYFLVGCIGGVFCLTGREFRYPILGKWLARFVEYRVAAEPDPNFYPLNEEREDRWAAAMSHATVVITMWGLALPLVVWLTEKNRSEFLRFQTLQALAYQVIGLLIYLGSYTLYMISMLGMFVGLSLLSANADSGGGGLFLFLILFVILMFMLVFLVFIPLYQILGQWATVRILQGRDYQYPLLGRWLRNRLDQASGRPAVPNIPA